MRQFVITFQLIIFHNFFTGSPGRNSQGPSVLGSWKSWFVRPEGFWRHSNYSISSKGDDTLASTIYFCYYARCEVHLKVDVYTRGTGAQVTLCW